MTHTVCGLEINMTPAAIESLAAERECNTCHECGEVSYELEKVHELSDTAHAVYACPDCAALIAGVLDSAENQADYDYLVALHRRYRKPIVSERAYVHAAAVVNGPFRMLVGDCPF